MAIHWVIFLIFVHVSLLVPGYVIIRKTGWLRKSPGTELAFGYLVSIALFATFAIADYALKFPPTLSRILCWIIILGSLFELYRSKYFRDLIKLRFPLICLFLLTLMSTAYIGLSFNAPKLYQPDPSPQPDRNYNVLNVKVLNVSQTPANDNYIPYRQAQFFVNRLHPVNSDFINEWGVSFFERTPLMGAVTANYFNLLNEKLPVDYAWSAAVANADHTYRQFQLIAHVMLALFIIPAYFLLIRLFNNKTAITASLFMVISSFFLYNAVFSWPKSLVAFFILLSWLLLLEKRPRYAILAGVASGLAYLTHDLAILYIAASLLLLLWQRRIRDMFWVGGIAAAFIFPWFIVSSLLYHKPSSFILYPISLEGIPQPGQKDMLIHQFFHTSPLHILAIKIKSFYYLTVPYEIFTWLGKNALIDRIWAFNIFAIPGSIGLGMLIPTILGFIKRWRDARLWILVFVPIIASTLVIGWLNGLGALHFAEGVSVVLFGIGSYFLTGLKNRVWLFLAFAASAIQLALFVSTSYRYVLSPWLHHPSDLILLVVMTGIVAICGWTLYRTAYGKKTWLTA